MNQTRDKHTVLVLNPGHFHAALTLRLRHPRLSDVVHVYAQDGPELESFVRIVQTFNERENDPTRWDLRIYRGADFIEQLLKERAGDIVIVAGKNNSKMASIHRLHDEGFCVLGDKPWLIDVQELATLRPTAMSLPLAMDIMTERHEIATRLQHALARQPAVFGGFNVSGSEPAISIRSVHHLYKVVNGRPLVRPAWYFDTAVQGEGMTDVTTHLVDLVQWMTGDARPFDYERDFELLSARQWPTVVPRTMFTRITGLVDLPPALHEHMHGDSLHLLCNAALSFRIRGTPVELESVWALAIPEGGGDTHHAVLRGSKADLVVEQGIATGFVTELAVKPRGDLSAFAEALSAGIASLSRTFPGVRLEPRGDRYRVVIPSVLRTTHEDHFAAVLDQFIAYIDDGVPAPNVGPDLVAKYTLLAKARELSQHGV